MDSLFAYLDENNNVVPVESLIDALNKGHEVPKHIALDEFEHGIRKLLISTVFMGINLNLTGKPEWFETVIWGEGKGAPEPVTQRHATYDDAMAYHNAMKEFIRAARPE